MVWESHIDSPILLQNNLLPFLILTSASELRPKAPEMVRLLLSAGRINCSPSGKEDAPPPTLQLMWITLLWTLAYKYLFGICLISLLSGFWGEHIPGREIVETMLWHVPEIHSILRLVHVCINFVYPFIYQWTCELFPSFGYVSNHWCTTICSSLYFQLIFMYGIQ